MPQSKSNEAPQPTLRPPCRELPPRRRRVPKPIIIERKPRYRRSDRGERMLTVSTRSEGTDLRPMIRMRGSWLEKLGFTIGARVAVSEEHGRLIVTLVTEE